jgi:hypothetical protein
MRLITLAILCLAAAAGSAHALSIDFSEDTFTIDVDISTFNSITQDAAGVSVSGTDDQSLAGTFAPVNFTGVTSLFLTGTLGGINPNSGFTVLLFNFDFSKTRTYSGMFNGYGVTSASTSLIFVSEESAFTSVAGFQLLANGTGDAVNFTFLSLSDTAVVPAAVPEPSTALAGAALIALVGASRRRHSGRRAAW